MPEPLTGFEDIVFHIERGDLVDILEHPKPGRYAGQRLSLTMHRITDPTRELVVVVDGEPATVVLDPLLRCSTRIRSTTVWSSVRSGNPYQTLIHDGASGQYSVNWRTVKAWKGTCRRLTLSLDDGSTHSGIVTSR